jgi:hypothetical protein
MIAAQDRIRELVGWDLDACEHRPACYDDRALANARRIVAQRPPFAVSSALVQENCGEWHERLSAEAARADLQEEMRGLEWSLRIVDLRCLLAFQRRLCFKADMFGAAGDLPSGRLDPIDLAFGPAKPAVFDLDRDDASSNLVLRSRNPNLHFRFSSDASKPISVHGGSPFFEVAQYRERWFLRDGYHRAYALLRAGVFSLPAVIIQAKDIEELGAAQPWFFPEEILFSPSPPRVTDFLDDALTVEYERPPLIKTLRISIEESIGFQISSGGAL